MSDPPTPLAGLLTRAAAGDRDAFADFFDATYRAVETWIDPTLSPAERDELLLAAYIRVWIAAPSFHDPATGVIHWLATVTAPALKPDPHQHARAEPSRPSRRPVIRLLRRTTQKMSHEHRSRTPRIPTADPGPSPAAGDG